jgi:hypothetical protein
MFNALRLYYSAAPDFLQTVWDYTVAGLEMGRPEQAQFREIAIFFWREVAVFEKEVKQSHGLILTAREFLLPKFWEIMCEVPAVHTDVEDPNENSPVMYATLAVVAFYQAAPAEIFTDFISPTFVDAIQGRHEWPVQHAAVLLLYCLSAEEGHPETFDFVRTNFNHLIEFCERVDVPRIRETALYVLAMVLKSYKAIFVAPGPEFNCENLVLTILSLLQLEPNIHPVILSRYPLIVFHLAGIWTDKHRYLSPLPPFFKQFVDILKTIMSRPIESEDDIVTYQNACEALNLMILNGSSKERNDLQELFQATLREMDKSGRMIEADSVRYIVQARLSSNLTSLAIAIGKDMGDDDLRQALQRLFHILEQRDALIYEEAIMSLAGLYMKLSERFPADEFDRLLVVVRDGLSTESPDVIHSASILLGDLYDILGKQLVDQFPESLEVEPSAFAEVIKRLKKLNEFVLLDFMEAARQLAAKYSSVSVML